MTTEQPIKIARGEDVTISGTVVDENGTAVNISADSILFTVKDNLSDADSAKIFQIAGTGLTSGGAFSIVIADTNTKTLEVKSRWYDIELLTSGGAYQTVARGKFILTGEVTRA